ncbi:hypothetical protein [Microbacterium sp.]|uniref:hypothetical protein n=1 Tax=Microbacterium sp. TaxID=51671 RepID=UPI0026065A86|nr:hypothetical protein [Microbacterium sp.]
MDEILRYTRIVCNADGGSEFVDDEMILTQQHIADGLPPMAACGLPSSAGTMYIRSAELDGAPHTAPRRQWVVMLRGVMEVQVTDGSRRQFGPGDLLIAEDTTGRGHVSVAVGKPPFEALFVPL